jgi:membrane-associated phospholipid phosphatase
LFKALRLCLLFSLLPLGTPLRAQTSPFPYEFGTEGWVLASAGLGLTSLGYVLNAHVDPITREEIRTLSPESVNSFDRFATGNWSPEWAGRSDAFRMGTFGAGLLVLGVEGSRAAIDGRSDDAMKLAAMFGEVVLLTTGATYATKVLAGRRRPFLHNQSLSVEERYEIASSGEDDPTSSFFSGHASGAFAAATFASTVFQDIHGTSGWSHLVWGSTLSLASLTAYARVKAGVHYPSDVIVGALVGAGIGYLVPRLHRKSPGEETAPTPGLFQLNYQIRF